MVQANPNGLTFFRQPLVSHPQLLFSYMVATGVCSTVQISCFMAEHFTQAGACVVAVNYALAPSVTLAEITRQCRAAVTWTCAHAHEFGGRDCDYHHDYGFGVEGAARNVDGGGCELREGQPWQAQVG